MYRYVLPLRIQVNQSLSHFFFDCAGAKKKLTKRNAALRGSAPHPATFEKVDETFLLLTASVSARRRAKPLVIIFSAVLPEKDPLL